MVSSQFEIILKDFESFFNCSLSPDQGETCLIKLAEGISIQLELDRQGLLLIGCLIGAMPASRYRNKLIHEALKSNALTPPSTGVFGISQSTHQFILFMLINPDRLNAERIAMLMPPFIAKAKIWTEAINAGQLPVVSQTP
jgi:Tir chaperone protein (CesT) family